MTPQDVADTGPATRLLDGVCALAQAWLANEPRTVDIATHGGTFSAEEIARWSVKAPAVRIACLAIASASEDGLGTVGMDFRLAAVVAARDVPGRPAGRSGEGRRMADRLVFELARGQVADDGRSLWARAVFSAAELDGSAESRGCDIGEPREIRAANLYSAKIDRGNLSLWAVTWKQEFQARPADFSIPLPDPVGIPATVLSGRAPDIGAGHEDDYETIVEPEGS